MRDEQFDSLQRLLSLKKFEVPPPGYFNGFSARVIYRIEQQARRDAEGWGGKWRWLPFLNTHRMLAGATALTIAGLGFVGISLALVLTGDADGTPITFANGGPTEPSHVMAGFGGRGFPGAETPGLVKSEGVFIGISGIDAVAPVRYLVDIPTNLFGIPSSRQLDAQQVGYPHYRAELIIEPRR
jgi:hypothetical protein